MRRVHYVLAAICAALSLCGTHIAQAQDFPSRPVRIVVAFPPGGPTDFVGRLVADKMTALLGQRVYIDNKPGANGTLGGGDIAKSDPDGYSLFLTTAGAVVVSPHIMASMPYDTLKDFVPVALVTKVTEVMVVKPGLGIKSVKDLVAMAKEKPGTITFASTGIGSPPHLAQEMLDASAGVQFLHVPYRGAAPALTDLLGGQVQVVVLDMPVVISQIRAPARWCRSASRQTGADPDLARRSDIRRTGLSKHRRVELVRITGAGENSIRARREAEQGGQRRACRSCRPRETAQCRRDAGRRHAGFVRHVP